MFTPQILHKLLFSHVVGKVQSSKEHFKRITYARLGTEGWTERDVNNCPWTVPLWTKGITLVKCSKLCNEVSLEFCTF